MRKIPLPLSIFIIILMSACTNTSTPDFNINFEKYTLDNGLTVILHQDHSDPVVAVSLTAHVGSARELPGKTGFAHLFEHLLFNESENLGRGGLDMMSARIGGSGANGSTSNDRTNYFQTVPKDALEKMLWAEADKLGWFINTVTIPVLEKEKQVVKNEKRQNYDNRPYGHTSGLITENLYPKGHPYSHTVIGSLEDLQSATLQDVKDFYNRWYVPNNVTLVIAGDFETEQTKLWVENYFAEIEKGEDIPELEKEASALDETKMLYYEDNFARLPYLTLTWPGVHQYHPDSYALDIMTEYLSRGQKAPLYEKLVKEKMLSSNAGMYSSTNEVAGQISLSVMAFQGKDLDEVNEAIKEAFEGFEEGGIPQKDLDRIKAGSETSFYRGLSSVMGKSNQLARYSIFAGDPGFISKDLQYLLDVTRDDVFRVYEKYIKGKALVATSFVPKGKPDLALEGSAKAEIKEEKLNNEVGGFDVNEIVEYERTPSSFDRTNEPPYGEAPETPTPDVWESTLGNGLKVFGIENDEVPMINLNISINGGMLLDDLERPGIARMMGLLMNKGTANKTPAELEEAMEGLGASISISAGKESFEIRMSCLEKNYNSTLELLEEMMFEPRWDLEEFDLALAAAKNSLEQQKASPGSIASNEFAKLVYGEKHIFSNNIAGSPESLGSMKMSDLKECYGSYFSPDMAVLNYVGSIEKEELVSSLAKLSEKWESNEVKIPEYSVKDAPAMAELYFYDMPGAKQSVIYLGYPCMDIHDADFYPATVMNYILGGGGFASRLTQVLRQEKGFTYGIRSGFSGSDIIGPFSLSTSVKTSNTLEALQLITGIMDAYPSTFSEEDLAVTKGYLIKKNARAFETSRAKLGMLASISKYGWDYDYVRQQEEIVRNMTVEKIRSLASRYVDPNKMIYLIVGDATTQMEGLMELGFGEAELLN